MNAGTLSNNVVAPTGRYVKHRFVVTPHLCSKNQLPVSAKPDYKIHNPRLFVILSTNQAGYDLLVNGEEFQVKCVADISSVSNHFEKYPDIPVFINEEISLSLDFVQFYNGSSERTAVKVCRALPLDLLAKNCTKSSLRHTNKNFM